MRILLLPISLCCLFLATACAPPRERFFWPPPTEQPMIEFIGVYTTGEDLLTGVAKTFAGFTGGSGEGVYQPTAVVADGHGKVYVSDSEFNKVVLFDFVKESYTEYINEGLKKPFGLALDSKGNLYVVERQGKAIAVFSPDKSLLFKFGEKELGEPIRIAVDEERGRIYVSDRKDHQVKVFSLTGQFIQSIGNKEGLRSNVDGEFNGPNDLVVDGNGNLYVCDQINSRVEIFDPSGAFLRKFGIRGDQNHTFEAPMGIALDNANNIWVADIRKGSLMTFSNTTDPKFLLATYGPSTSPGLYNMKSPMDVFIDKNNRLYVADGLAHRISVWQVLDEAYLAQHPLPADWMQRTNVIERWYKESGEKPPVKQEETTKKQEETTKKP